MKFVQVQILYFSLSLHGTSVRNRLAVRIAGSHPADRGSIPRYGSNHMVFSHNMADERFLCQIFLFHFVEMVNMLFEYLSPQKFVGLIMHCEYAWQHVECL